MFSILFYSALAQDCQTNYPPLQNQTWTNCENYSINAFYQERIVELDFKYYPKDLSSKFVKSEVQKSTELIFKFAELKGLKTIEVLPNLKLEIFQVSMDLLNDRQRFPEYQNMTNLSIWGLYDPRSLSEASIMITDHGSNWTKLTLAHELSHYWFDRFGWQRLWKKDPESFALEFERYYLKNGG